MKKITITKSEGMVEVWDTPERVGYPQRIECLGQEDMDASDGYHTFTELYDHRITLFIALCRELHKNVFNRNVWRSKLHSDGSSFEGWFIMGIFREKGNQITYHLPIERWEETNFLEGDATKEKAPEWDGHTPNDVLSRLKDL